MRAAKVSRLSESKRMFESDLFEFFSRIPPWQPPAIYLPVIAWSSYQAFAVGTGIVSFLGLFVVGLLAWTLMEYWLHRLVFHYAPSSHFGKRLIWYAHGVHHDWPNDKLRLVFPPAVSLPIAVLAWILFTMVFGEFDRYAAFVGLVSGYLAYDMLHYYAHHFVPSTRAGRYLRKYHLMHHHGDEDAKYGVSSPLWDLVFRTTGRPTSRAS
ncbi:MAG: sterol desaturase family protein [Deltaproteobacteria bacterium]|nr:sterol desaturase family protein [Deltaproteobacteria bacterium]